MLETQAPSWYFVALVVQVFAGCIVKMTRYLLFVASSTVIPVRVQLKVRPYVGSSSCRIYAVVSSS
jgi:hypothetical protein